MEAPLLDWFKARGWKALPFQREVWTHYLEGRSGLLHTPTGSGKTLAAFGGPLLEAVRARRASATPLKKNRVRPLQVLWITPLKALAADTTRALSEAIAGVGLDWQVGQRTGDASSRDKRLARAGKLDVLVTTPESLALLLSYPDTAPQLRDIRAVIVDEWHELLANKRGVLLQLCLARLRKLTPGLRTWGLSATLGNLDEAAGALMLVVMPGPGTGDRGPGGEAEATAGSMASTGAATAFPGPRSPVPSPGTPVPGPGFALVSGVRPRTLTLETLRPKAGERFPWSGHLGLAQLSRVLDKLLAVKTSLVFTNTRAQAELWHQALAAVWPEDPATLALHHGSLSPRLRNEAEQGLREGTLRCVVATSSLDLGVDFPAVDQVLQIGSPKGIARLLQRAGRARHRPGEAGHVVCVPTHALELVEYAAARRAIARAEIEPRHAPRLSLDVLAQHCVTLALGGGFAPEALLAEVRGTQAFAALDDATWRAVLDFIEHGGSALERYPDFHKVVRDADGVYRVHERRVALRHRLSIGTITSDGSVQVKFLRGGGLGSIEELFVGRLRRGDRFQFAGRLLELVRLEDMTAYVRVAKGGDGTVPKWMGGRMPLSSELGREVEATFGGDHQDPELRAIAPLLALQERLSALPAPGTLLCEQVKARDGQHLFLYPFAGRQVHEGLAALLALRWGRLRANTFAFAANDYGLVLSPANQAELDQAGLHALLSPAQLVEDLTASLNLGELARRQFREIARVSGLLPPSLPGKTPRSMRQLQASSGLLFDVLSRHDPDHLLLHQAQREVFTGALELDRLAATLRDCAQRSLAMHRPRSLTPLSFPLWAESLRGQLSTEDWKTRVQRAAQQLEKKHGR
ncbi:DEAD/DEAH box helicase [Pseudoxanthomonas composti]|nr:DEAD/DEAH box helicase [Pseudoxanthomonas composti]